MIARKGVIQVPGGRGVFPSLTVAENLKVALWMHRRDPRVREDAPPRRRSTSSRRCGAGLSDPAAQLSGGQQQMLALAMAFLAKPDVLMIDELSLGLAPLVVEQLLAVVRQFREQGVTVILVEQSVNVALTTADKAFFMEKGAIRFHGLTAGAARTSRPAAFDLPRRCGGGRRRRSARKPRRTRRSPTIADRAPEPVHANGGERRVVLETRGITRRFSGITAVDDVSLQLHEGEILGIVGPERRGQDHAVRPHLGVPRSPTRARSSSRASTSRVAGRSAAPSSGLARSFQDARLFGALTVHQTICVALDRPIQVWDPVTAMLYFPNVVLAERRLGKRADELIEMMGLDDYRDKFVSDLSTGSRRIVDLACQIGIEPKVILFDEPSSGIAQRETEALGPLLLRIRDITGASILLIEHDMPLVSSVSDRIIACDLGRVVVEGDWELVRNHPHVVASYLGSTREVIERSGPSQVRAPPKLPREHVHDADRDRTRRSSRRADEQTAYEDLSWFRRILRKYTNSFSVARSSLFWALLRREKKTLKWLFIVMIIYTAGLLQVTNLTRGMIDNGIVNQVAPLWDYLRYITFWALWALVFSLAQQQIADRLAYQIEFDMRVWLYTHIQSADLRRLDQVATGQLVTRSLTDIQLVDTLLKTFPQLIGYAPILLSVAIIVTIINPIMGVLSILALPINVWLVNKFRSRLRALSWAELNERAEVTTAIDEPVRGIRVVKAFGREDQERERVAKRHRARVPLRDDPHAAPRRVRHLSPDDAPARAGRLARAPVPTCMSTGSLTRRHVLLRVPDRAGPQPVLQRVR